MARFVTYEALELNRLDLIDFWFLVIFNAMAFFMYILLTCIKDNILVKSDIFYILYLKAKVAYVSPLNIVNLIENTIIVHYKNLQTNDTRVQFLLYVYPTNSSHLGL